MLRSDSAAPIKRLYHKAMASGTTQLEIVAKMRDEASASMKNLAKNTENATNETMQLGSAMKGALGALSAYAGFQGLGSLINAYQESNLQLAQARFYLAGYSSDVKGNFDILTKWGSEQQKILGVGDEYATLVAARLLPRLKDMSKAQDYANILLRGQRIGMLDASEAANMLMRATDGNERALRFLLEQWGIAAPEFVSMQTLFEELKKRIEAAEDGLSPFAAQWNRLKETFGDFMESAGLPVVTVLAAIFSKINALIERVPAFGNIISAVLLAVAGGLAGLGLALGLETLLGFFGITLAAAGPWGLAIGAAIALVLYYLTSLSGMTESTKKYWEAALIGMASAAALAFAAIGSVFFLPLATALAALAVITRMSIEGYELSWSGFKDFLKDTFVGVGIIIRETWDALLGWLKSQFDAFVGWVSQKVTDVVAMVSRAVAAAASLPGVSQVVGAAQAVGSFVAGKRAAGGPVANGSPYLVGERGPEIFVPGMSGAIIPNGGIAGGGSVMIDMRGSTFMSRDAAVDVGDLIIRRLREMYRIGI